MVYGHDGFAGELGHVIARRDGRICGCGRKGCLETYCSATGVARTAREFLAARTDASLLRNIPAESITSKDVYDAAVQGDKLAQEIFWVKLWQMLLHSPVLKQSYCSEVWLNQAIIS